MSPKPSPIYNDQPDDLIVTAARWLADGYGVALAIVMQTWGSSPRPVGSMMIIRDDNSGGAIMGSVSGGCVEGAVIDAGLRALGSGRGERLDFGVADETAWQVGLSCGGKIAVLVTPVIDANGAGLPVTILGDAAAALGQRKTVRLRFDATSGAVLADDDEPHIQPENTMLDEDRNRFFLVQHPPRRLIIIGGVHITQFLAPMAKQAGYDVLVIDPRSMFVTAERFPDITFANGWPDEILATRHIDASTAIVTLTHDPKIDDPALDIALRHDCFYIAALGSRKTHSARCERLAAAGFDAATIARIHGPAGLAIGARTPAQIAVSVLAEMIAVEQQTKKA